MEQKRTCDEIAAKVDYKTLVRAIKDLNGSGALEEGKVDTKNLKKPEVINAFVSGVESVPEGSPLEKKIPKPVVTLYNQIIDLLEGKEPVEEKKDEKKKNGNGKPKEEKVKKLGNIPTMVKLLKEKASEQKITKTFTQRYGEKDVTDKEFIKKRIGIYKGIAEKELESATK